MPSVIKLHDFVGQQPDKQGMRSADFAALLSAAGEDVEIHINSSGGTVTDGFHMANLLRSHGGKTVAVIEGVCASAATFLAAACDRVEAYEASLIMVHGPWGGAQGNTAKLRESADLLDKLAEGMASLYRRRGISEDTIAKWLASESTYFTPEGALEAGLIDAVIKQPQIDVSKARALLHQQVFARMQLPLLSGREPKGNAMTDEEKAKAKAAAKAKFKAEYVAQFGDEPSTTDEHKAKVRANAEDDPEVQARMKALLATTERAEAAAKKFEDALAKIESEKAFEKNAAEFVTYAKGKLSPDAARQYMQDIGGDLSKAKAFADKLPVLKDSGQIFRDGVAGANGVKAMIPNQNTIVTNSPLRTVIQHGVQEAAMVRAMAEKLDAKRPLSERLIEARAELRQTHPHFYTGQE